MGRNVRNTTYQVLDLQNIKNYTKKKGNNMLSIYGGTGEDLSKTMIVTLKGNNYVGNIDLFKDDNVEIGQV